LSASFEARGKACAEMFGTAFAKPDAVAPKKASPYFSLKYNGKPLNSSQLKCRVENIREDADASRADLVYSIDEGVLDLRVNVVVWKKFPTIEYYPQFENVGDKESGIVSDFNVLNIVREITSSYYGKISIKDWSLDVGSKLGVRCNLGSTCAATDFFPVGRTLFPRYGENKLALSSHEGRSSNAYMPFFGVDESENSGMDFAVGWTGGWKADVEMILKDPDSAFQSSEKYGVKISMQKNNFKTLPREKLRQIAVMVQFRDGMDVDAARNIHRRLMVAHHSPRDSKGNVIVPPISLVTWGGLETKGMLERIDVIRREKLPYEVFWLDAGWSGADAPCPHFVENTKIKSDWFQRIGLWRMNRYAHPDGLAPISDAAKDAGMKMLVWFEVERVFSASGADVIKEHPDWLLKAADAGKNGKPFSYLLDLGNPDARKWLTETISGLIKSEKVGCYRQDFNINPAPIWADNDAPDRVGVNEMKHIAGLYEFWGALRKEFPDMLIDNCASGGRRLDFIAAGYGMPLCQSDYTTFMIYNFDVVQLENYYLPSMLPLQAGITLLPEGDTYSAFASAGTGFSPDNWGCNGREVRANYDYNWLRDVLNAVKRMREIKINGDYYPLSPDSQNLEKWSAVQFDRPDKNEGFVLAFRRDKCVSTAETFRLSGIDKNAEYELEYFDGGVKKVSGSELAEFKISLGKPRSCGLVWYKKISK